MPSFVEIGPPVPLKKTFEVFFTIYRHSSHLCHVTWITYVFIGSPILQMLHIKFGFGWPSGFREEDL